MKKLDTNSIARRDFLKLSSASAAALAFPAPLRCLGTTKPQGEPNPILVVIYLRGGQDALNTVVPYKNSRYYEIRPTIAIAPKPGDGVKGVVKLDKSWGIHPAMAPLEPLWRENAFAPIVNVGSPHPTRSHFDAQDFMEFGSPGRRVKAGGWLNRYLQLTSARAGADSELRALAMQGLLPRSLRGKYPVLAVPEREGRQAGKYLDLFDDLYNDDPDAPKPDAPKPGKPKKRGMARRDDPVVQSGQNTIKTLRRYQEIVNRGDRRRRRRQRRGSYPQGRLGARLEDIAKVIKAGERLEVACVDWNGWDHHAGEGSEAGRISGMLAHLSASVAAFLRDLGTDAKRTVVMTMTEFGRTCRENGNAGTDHGHGGVMLCAGAVNGGQVLGRFDGLDDRDMYQGRDLPVTTDFRDVMAEILVRHMGVKKLPKDFFPDFKPSRKGIGLIG